MKIKLLLAVILLSVTFQLNAQERSAFRAGYLRLGINQLGEPLDQSMSPIRNIFDSRYGASEGFAFEFGRIFYVGGKDHQGFLNLGLDWTMLSLNYNKMDKWEEYGENSGAETVSIGGKKIALSASTKLGPVLSINLLEKIVIDARFQLAPTLRFFDFSYRENEGMTSERYFNFTNYSREIEENGFDAESVKNRLAFGLAKSFGVTLRRKAIGVSADYITGDVKSYYEAINSNFGEANGKDKIPFQSVQITLNLTF
jgi:hypothetical protein